MCAVFLLFQNTRAHTTAHLLQRRSKFIAFSFHFLCVFCFQKIIKNRKWKEKMIFRSCLISFCLRIIQYIHYQRMFCWSLFSLWLRSPHSFAHWIYDFTCRCFKLATRLFRHLSKQNELNSYKKTKSRIIPKMGWRDSWNVRRKLSSKSFHWHSTTFWLSVCRSTRRIWLRLAIIWLQKWKRIKIDYQ